MLQGIMKLRTGMFSFLILSKPTQNILPASEVNTQNKNKNKSINNTHLKFRPRDKICFNFFKIMNSFSFCHRVGFGMEEV